MADSLCSHNEMIETFVFKGYKNGVFVNVDSRNWTETIFGEHHIHYLSIHVEGAEMDVIRNIDFDKVFIDVIRFENRYFEVSLPIVEYLQSKGYVIFHK